MGSDGDHISPCGVDIICSPVRNGVLKLRILGTFSQALLGRWLWHCGDDKDHLWRRIVCTKYKEEWGQ